MAVGKKILNKKSIPISVVLGSTLSMAITLAGALGIALILEREMIQEAGENYAVIILPALAAFCGGMTATQAAGRNLLPIAMGTGGLYLVLLLCCNALFFDGRFADVGLRFLTVTAGSSGALLVRMKKNGGKPARKKYKIR